MLAIPFSLDLHVTPAEPAFPVSEEGVEGTGLSNDYLNHYSEALMLIELAADDPEIAADLTLWEPISYEAYFGNSLLRRAPRALAAYEALPVERRARFQEITGAMDELALAAIRALRPPCGSQAAARVAGETGPALRRLVDRAAAFLNSGGEDLACNGEVEEAQRVIDRLIEREAAAA